MSVLTSVLRFVVSIVLTIVATVAPGKMADSTAPNAPMDAESCKLNFAVVSDTHMKVGIEGLPNGLVFHLAMKDFEAADKKYDALVFVGDNTDHGYEDQWAHFE